MTITPVKHAPVCHRHHRAIVSCADCMTALAARNAR